MLYGDCLDRIPGRKTVGEAGAHHAGKSGDQQSLLQVEFLDRGALLFGRHLAFFGYSGCSGERDTKKTYSDAAKDHAPGTSAENFRCEYSTKKRRHQGAECGCVPECHGHAERHSQVSHGQAEGEAAESPQNSKYICPEKAARRSFVKHMSEVVCHGKCENPRGDEDRKSTRLNSSLSRRDADLPSPHKTPNTYVQKRLLAGAS